MSILIKGTVQEENITIVNAYAINIGAPKNMKQFVTIIKGQINNNTTLAGNDNSQIMERTCMSIT